MPLLSGCRVNGVGSVPSAGFSANYAPIRSFRSFISIRQSTVRSKKGSFCIPDSRVGAPPPLQTSGWRASLFFWYSQLYLLALAISLQPSPERNRCGLPNRLSLPSILKPGLTAKSSVFRDSICLTFTLKGHRYVVVLLCV